MGQHLNRMTFELSNSPWTNSISVVTNKIDADITGNGEVSVANSNGTNSSRSARDVSFESVRADVDEMIGDLHWSKVYSRRETDLISLLIWANLFMLVLNFFLTSK